MSTAIFYSPFTVAIFISLGAMVYYAVVSITSSIEKVAKHRQTVELKQMLVDRGMSVEEIERIVRAGDEGDFSKRA